jgi:opacity protein-like surface antigen
MSIFTNRLALAFAVMALCCGARTAHAQASPLTYWTPGWPIGFAGDSSQSSNTYGNFPGFNGSNGNGYNFSRYNFSNGWFIGSESRSLSLAGSDPGSSFNYQGTQFGYNFQNAPLTLFGGISTLNYSNSGPFAAFDSSSNSNPAYSAHVGVAYRPTSNLSLSLGVGYTQQQLAPAGSVNSLVGPSPFGLR